MEIFQDLFSSVYFWLIVVILIMLFSSIMIHLNSRPGLYRKKFIFTVINPSHDIIEMINYASKHLPTIIHDSYTWSIDNEFIANHIEYFLVENSVKFMRK